MVLFLILLFFYPYILGYIVPIIIRPFLLEGIPTQLQKNAYLLSIESISFSINFKEIEIQIGNLKIKNPTEYLTFNKLNEPKNCIEIETMRFKFIINDLIQYCLNKFTGRIKIQQLFVNKVKINILRYETIESLNLSSICGMITKKDKDISIHPITESNKTSTENSNQMEILIELSTLIINKLKIRCYKLFDSILYSALNRNKDKKRIEISLLNFITYKNKLIPNYKKNKKKDKYYDMTLVLYALGKLILFQLLNKNREEVMLLTTSGAFDPIQKFIRKRVQIIRNKYKNK